MNPQQTQDEQWMRLALREAEKARAIAETPVGAVIVRDGQVIARGFNQRETRQDVTLHAEMIALRQACARLGSWRLEDCALYVTLEPCAMCASAIQQARVARVVFGATDPKTGAVVSRLRFFDLPWLNHAVLYTGGVLATACADALRAFFTWLRANDRARGSRGARRDHARAQTQQQSDAEAHSSHKDDANQSV